MHPIACNKENATKMVLGMCMRHRQTCINEGLPLVCVALKYNLDAMLDGQ